MLWGPCSNFCKLLTCAYFNSVVFKGEGLNLFPRRHLAISRDSFGEGNGTPLQNSCLENPMMEEPRGLQSMVSLSRTWLSNFTFTFHFHALEEEMATHSSVLAWRIPGTREPGGLPSMGSHRVRHDWSDLAVAAAWSTSITTTKLWDFLINMDTALSSLWDTERQNTFQVCACLWSVYVFK